MKSFQLPRRLAPGAPDLAVEILSPTDHWSDIEEKVAEYLRGPCSI
jgi:Uma2 family endonuclease